MAKLYGSVSGQTKQITKLYGAVLAPESYSMTPDGTVVTAIDGEVLCAVAKGQYPNTYMNVASFEFEYNNGTYYANGLDTNNNPVFYKSGGYTTLQNAGITFGSSLTSGDSATIPAAYEAATYTTTQITKLYGPIAQQITTGVTGTIRAGATQVTAFDADVFFAAASPDLDLTKTLSYIQVSMVKKGTVYSHDLRVYYSDGTYYELFYHNSDGTMADFLAYGITATEPTGVGATDYIDLTPITTTITVTKEIFNSSASQS